MNVAVFSTLALGALLAIGCAGEEIATADSAAPAPGSSNPITALDAAPADVAFVTVSDIRADIVGPDGLPFDTLYGYGYAAELVTADPPLEELALALTPAEAMAPPFNGDVDLDAFFSAAIPAAGQGSVVWDRAPEMQRVDPAIIAPPPDAK